MTLEQQCISLPLAKRLKELGVKQESYFMWEGMMADVNKMRFKVKKWSDNHNPERYSAFTAAELGEMLPSQLTKRSGEVHYLNTYRTENNNWSICYEAQGYCDFNIFENRSEVLGRGLMLIYLIENNFVNPKDL